MIPGRRADRTRSPGSTIPWPTIRQAEVSPAPLRVFRAPGLELLTGHIAARQRCDILDLGSPSRANVEYLSQFSCVLHIGDVSRALAEDPETLVPEEERDVEGVVERAIVFEDHIRFNAIFAWNLFDYLDEATSRAIMRRIGGYCCTGTLLYLTTSNSETIPDQPGRFTIVDERNLRVERVGVGTRSGMQHSPRGLERIMPGFRLHHSFLLGYQMQDYVFIHE